MYVPQAGGETVRGGEFQFSGKKKNQKSLGPMEGSRGIVTGSRGDKHLEESNRNVIEKVFGLLGGTGYPVKIKHKWRNKRMGTSIKFPTTLGKEWGPLC